MVSSRDPRAVGALLLATVAAWQGCGGEEPEPEGTGQASARVAGFSEEVEAACARRNAAVRRPLEDRSGGAADSLRKAAVARLDEVVLPAVTEQVSHVRGLDIPLSRYSEVEAALDKQDEAVVQLEGLDDVRSFEIVEIHFAAADRMWKALGIDKCTMAAIYP